MSYDISLRDPVTDEVLSVSHEHFVQGGTYCTNGAKALHLNITYNYGSVFSSEKCFGRGGLTALYGKTGAESIPVLECAIGNLGDDVDPDYWKCTEGNVKKALCGLLSFARMRPDGVWRGDY